MKSEMLDQSLIEDRFEHLIEKSKSYINTRNEDELASLRNDLVHLKIKFDTAIENNNNGHDLNYLTSLKLILSIIHKFTYAVELMDNLKSKKPLCKEIDAREMLDILLPNIKCIIEYKDWSTSLDTQKLEQNYKFIESLEDQHKRVLLSYLIQDYRNMDEVLNLLKIGEIYKNIAEKLVNLSLLSTFLAKH